MPSSPQLCCLSEIKCFLKLKGTRVHLNFRLDGWKTKGIMLHFPAGLSRNCKTCLVLWMYHSHKWQMFFMAVWFRITGKRSHTLWNSILLRAYWPRACLKGSGCGGRQVCTLTFINLWINLHVARKVMLWGRAITMTIMTSYTVNYLFQLKVTRIHPDQTEGSFRDMLYILCGDAAASQNMFNHILVTRKPLYISQACLFLNIERHLWSRGDKSIKQQQWQSCTCFTLSPWKCIHLHQQVRKVPESNIKTFTGQVNQLIIILYL